MKKDSLIIENGVIAGNVYDKYGSRNPIARRLMKGFTGALDSLVELTNASDIHEVGCGEGDLAVAWALQGKKVRACDFSKTIIERAKTRAREHKIDIAFKAASVYDLRPETDAAQLVICCEVLEHLHEPERALAVLAKLARPHLIVSVPREPLWRLLNLARGKYLLRGGSTPGHVQAWSKGAFAELIASRFDIVRVLSPLPWTMILARTPRES